MAKDRQVAPDRNIRKLWARGKFWEIFGFSSGDFTTLELAKQYSALTRTYHESTEDKRIIDDAFATLNAPLTRQFYEGCRMVMQRIRHEIGDAQFRAAEDRIWLDLWNWVSERWQEPPDEIINAIKTKYSHPRSSKQGATEQTQTWSDQGLKPADLDSVMAAEAFTKEIKCQSCGKFDHTLRVVAFPYVVSILIASFRRAGEAGIFCHSCRCSKSLKWAIVSLLFGWWSIWGFFWNIGALIDNFRGGKMPRENNEPLIAKLVWVNMVLGKIAEAKAALKELFKYSSSEDTLRLQQELDEKYPTVPPAKAEKFRLGYLTVVFAILGVYVIAGIAMFGGTSTPSTYTPPSSSQPTSPIPESTPSSATESDLSSNLLIYLDDKYTKLWDSTNIPDLNSIPWSSPDSDGWETGTLIVYLKNIGRKTIEVSASATESPRYAKIGFSVSSNTVILKPNEYSPITITIKQNPMVLSMASSSTSTTIYFHINPH